MISTYLLSAQSVYIITGSLFTWIKKKNPSGLIAVGLGGLLCRVWRLDSWLMIQSSSRHLPHSQSGRTEAILCRLERGRNNISQHILVILILSFTQTCGKPSRQSDKLSAVRIWTYDILRRWWREALRMFHVFVYEQRVQHRRLQPGTSGHGGERPA